MKAACYVFVEEFDAQRNMRAASVRLGLRFIRKASRGVLLFVASCFVLFFYLGIILILIIFILKRWELLDPLIDYNVSLGVQLSSQNFCDKDTERGKEGLKGIKSFICKQFNNEATAQNTMSI